jgi:hypothetical protein
MATWHRRLPVIFVCEDLDDVSFLLHMARVPTDVWSVDVDGIWLENGPSGWQVVIRCPGRLSLDARDIPVGGFTADRLHQSEKQPTFRPSSKRPADSRNQPRPRKRRT